MEELFLVRAIYFLVWLLLCVVCSILFFCNRKAFPIRGRQPALTVAQNFVMVLYVAHLTVSEVTPCYVYTWCAVLGLHAILLCFIARGWILLVKFEISSTLSNVYEVSQLDNVCSGAALTAHSRSDSPSISQGRLASRSRSRSTSKSQSATRTATSAVHEDSVESKHRASGSSKFTLAEPDMPHSLSMSAWSVPGPSQSQRDGSLSFAMQDDVSLVTSESYRSTWYLRHRGWIRRRFLARISLVLLLVYVAFLAVVTVTSSAVRCPDPCPIHHPMRSPGIQDFVADTVALGHVAILLYLATRLSRHGLDGYYIKTELKASAAVCIIASALGVCDWFDLFSDYHGLPYSIVASCLFLPTTVGPLLLVLKHRLQQVSDQHGRSSSRESHSKATETDSQPLLHDPMPKLSELLRYEAGFTAFLSHLQREFSSENLLFWKSVEDFRTLLWHQLEVRSVRGRASSLVRTRSGRRSSARSRASATAGPDESVSQHTVSNSTASAPLSSASASSSTAPPVSGKRLRRRDSDSPHKATRVQWQQTEDVDASTHVPTARPDAHENSAHEHEQPPPEEEELDDDTLLEDDLLRSMWLANRLHRHARRLVMSCMKPDSPCEVNVSAVARKAVTSALDDIERTMGELERSRRGVVSSRAQSLYIPAPSSAPAPAPAARGRTTHLLSHSVPASTLDLAPLSPPHGIHNNNNTNNTSHHGHSSRALGVSTGGLTASSAGLTGGLSNSTGLSSSNSTGFHLGPTNDGPRDERPAEAHRTRGDYRAEVRRDLLLSRQTLTALHDLFAETQGEIFQLMKKDSFPRFQRTHAYGILRRQCASGIYMEPAPLASSLVWPALAGQVVGLGG